MLGVAFDNLYGAFQRALENLGPFEDKLHMAVALSGGSDSLVLAFLLARWVREKNGFLTALHVDHQLRPESSEEARKVQKWMECAGVACEILSWDHAGIDAGLQDQARQARYSLLEDYCRQHHILHLCVAHHREDQAETFFYRQERKSGPDGLAGMASVEERDYVRVLRPLLDFSKEDLQRVLGDHPFLQDPSNENPRFWRARFRQESSVAFPEGALKQFEKQRIEKEQGLAGLLGQCVQVYEEGFVDLNARYDALEKDQRIFILQRVLTMVGGNVYPVSEKHVRFLESNMEKKTLGGCLVRRTKSGYRIMREAGRINHVHKASAHQTFHWDHRYEISVADVEGSLECRKLGLEGWIQIKPLLHKAPYGAAIYQSLPAFFDSHGQVVFFPFGDFKPAQKVINSAQVYFCPRSSLLRSIRFEKKV